MGTKAVDDKLISLRKTIPMMLMSIKSKEKLISRKIWRKAMLTLMKSKRSIKKETEIRRPMEETVALMRKLTLMPRNNLILICDPGFRYDDGENIVMYFLPKKTNLE